MSDVLSRIFDEGAEERFANPLDEAQAIAAAKLGDEGATCALLLAYAPVLRDVAARYRYSQAPTSWDGQGQATDRDELRQAAVLGLLEAIRAHDPTKGHRLAGTAPQYVASAAAESMADAVPVTVPSRTVRRFFGIIRRAGGDLLAGEALAPSFKMSCDTFRAVAQAIGAVRLEELELRGAEGTEVVASPLWDDVDAFAAAEDRIMVEVAFGAVEADERRVTRLYYGFETRDPLLSDERVAWHLNVEALGEERVEHGESVTSRASSQRTRTRALRKMRDALALDD